MRVQTIKECVAEYFGLTPSRISTRFPRGEDRWPRQLAIYLAWNLTGLSTPILAKAFQCKDHSTVIYARNKARQRIKEIPTCKIDYDALEECCLHAQGINRQKLFSVQLSNRSDVILRVDLTHDEMAKIRRFLDRAGILS